MSFTTAVATCFRRYATFSGRASRPEFWWFYLFVQLVNLAFVGAVLALLVGAVAIGRDGEPVPVVGSVLAVLYLVATLVSLVLLLPTLAAMWRRLHDTDRSGLWCFLAVVPVVGFVVLVIFWAQPGTQGPNRFGASPGAHAERAGPLEAGYGPPQQRYGPPA